MGERRGPRRDDGKERLWRNLVEDFVASGLTIRAWCREHQVSEPSFYAWRRELRRRDQSSATRAHQPCTARRKPRPDTKAANPKSSDLAPQRVQLLPVQIAGGNRSSTPRVIVCRGVLRLQVTLEQLPAVLDVLESRSC